MEVVDAEYQWCVFILRGLMYIVLIIRRRDRRKLTFYFIAEKRIDFRELVRELFRYGPNLLPRPKILTNLITDFIKLESGWRLSRAPHTTSKYPIGQKLWKSIHMQDCSQDTRAILTTICHDPTHAFQVLYSHQSTRSSSI